MTEITSMVPRPDGVVFSAAARSEKMGVALFKRKLALDLGPDSKLKLTDEERERMKKYEAPKATMWSASDKDEEFPPKQTIVVFNGLASNPDQLENEQTAFVNKLMGELSEEEQKRVNIVSISCPGFGDSDFAREALEAMVKDEDLGKKSRNLGIKNTSTEEYAAVARIWLKSLGLNPDNAVVSGHSTGAETALQFMNDGFEIFALNPSVHLNKSTVFERLNIANQVAKHALKFAPGLTGDFAQWLTDVLVGNGKDPSSKSQSEVHRKEEEVHQDAFRFKSKELIEPDAFPTAEDGSIAKLDPKRLHVLYSWADRLTPAIEAQEWIQEWMKNTDSKLEGNSLITALAHTIIPSDYVGGEQYHHDSVFIHPTLLDNVTKRMGEVLHTRLLRVKEVPAVEVEHEQQLQVIPVPAVPVNVDMVAEEKRPKAEWIRDAERTSERQVTGEEEVRKLILQGLTIETWIKAANLITSRISGDTVKFNDSDASTLMGLLWGHPAIQEFYEDKPTEFDAILNNGARAFMTLQELYFETNPDATPLYPYFHMFGEWGPRFAMGLYDHPEIVARFQTDGNFMTVESLPNLASKILVDSRAGILGIFGQLAIRGVGEMPINDDVRMLKDYAEALNMFRGVVHKTMGTTIAGPSR
jgi:pimeloyl-ACP methyl ester carboxylesterase